MSEIIVHKKNNTLIKWPHRVVDNFFSEEELRQLMNQHPEQFQNVDPYFFVNTLDKMRSTIATQKALKKVRLEEQQSKARVLVLVFVVAPFGWFLPGT